jgi:putative redox protein
VTVVARRRKGYAHSLTVRDHALVADEPESTGGTDAGPTPKELLALSLASCTAVTLEMYSERKGWELGELEVEVDYEESPEQHQTRFDVTLRLPESLSREQVERLEEIAAKCPVHRTLAGGAEISDRVERI